MTRPTVAEACARAVEAWLSVLGEDDCDACVAALAACESNLSDVAVVAAWGAQAGDPSCSGCHAIMTELSKLADPAGALALAVGRETGRLM